MRRVVMVLGAAVLLCACNGGEASEAPGQPARQPIDVVAIGDSLAVTGWVEQYGAQLKESLQVSVNTHVVNAMEIPDALKAVKSPGPEQDRVAGAELVIVEVGYNNAVPYPYPDEVIGCGGTLADDTPASFATWVRTTTPSCLDEGVATHAGMYGEVLAAIKTLRGDERTVLVSMGAPNADLAPVEAFPDWLLAGWADDPQEGKAWFVATYDRWNAMIQEQAGAAGYQYVDVYHAFNGPDGTSSYYPRYTDDGVHPNQAGNDAIVGVLRSVDVSAISGT